MFTREQVESSKDEADDGRIHALLRGSGLPAVGDTDGRIMALVQKGGPGSGVKGHSSVPMLAGAHEALVGLEKFGIQPHASTIAGLAKDYGVSADDLTAYHEAHKNDVVKKEELVQKKPVSEAQRGAMAAAAHGNSTLGIPKSVGEEFMSKDPGGKLPKVAPKRKMQNLFERAFGQKADVTVAQLAVTGGLLEPEQISHPAVTDADRAVLLPVHKSGDGEGETPGTSSKEVLLSKVRSSKKFEAVFGPTPYWCKPEWIKKRDFTDKKRKELAASGAAMSDGSYPIENEEDLHNAVSLSGMGSHSKASVKAHIKSRAKALGLTSKLPEDWGGEKKKAELIKKYWDEWNAAHKGMTSADHQQAAQYHAGKAQAAESSGKMNETSTWHANEAERHAAAAVAKKSDVQMSAMKTEGFDLQGLPIIVLKGGPGSGIKGHTTDHSSAGGEKEGGGFQIPSPKGRLPADATDDQKKAMYKYMNGFHTNLKNENERAYAVDRSRQMIEGTPRPSGMSAGYNMSKGRAAQYEALLGKIFASGRMKVGV